MAASNKSSLYRLIQSVLRPVVKILIRHGVSYAEFNEFARRTYVEVAAEHYQLPGRKQSTSRISVITGLNRKEVSRIKGINSSGKEVVPKTSHRASVVLDGWHNDERFKDGKKCLPLKFEDGSPNFKELVREHSGDMPPRAVLDELLRSGSVEKDAKGLLKVKKRHYIPHTTDEAKLNGISDKVEKWLTSELEQLP